MKFRAAICLAGLLLCTAVWPAGLDATRLGVVYNSDEPASRELALYYAQQRAVPAVNLVGVRLPTGNVLSPSAFAPLRDSVLSRLPSSVQSLLLVWSRPFGVGCMSITSAFAAGYRAGFCEPGCGATERNPLFDSEGWLPADTVGWWPAMLLPTDDIGRARALIQRGKAAQLGPGAPVLYLIRTPDKARNVRAATYSHVGDLLAKRLAIVELATPVKRDVPDAIGYFTGAVEVEELRRVRFLPGAVADHLTSTGGVLAGGRQMPATAWLAQGATGSYGTVSEPCNHLEKFPNVAVLMTHYLRGETLLESYWKSVAMPGQGLFVGEPLARPFAADRQ